jgi:hypothetical protein
MGMARFSLHFFEIMSTVFSLLQRKSATGSTVNNLVTPIQFSIEAQHHFQACKNPILIVIEGKTGAGKSTRLNQIINAQMRAGKPFIAQGGGRGVTSDFQVWGPVRLAEFCGNWNFQSTAEEEFNLFFVDSEGVGNAYGTDNNLAKALAAVSAITTVRIALGEGRLTNDTISGVESTLKLQCLQKKRSAEIEISSAVVLMYREVGFEGEPALSLAEMEQRRRTQDQNGFEIVLNKFPKLGFTPNNLLVLEQPQLADAFGAIDFAPESYLESLRDLARFIDGVCRRKRSPGFAWMDTILTSIAEIIDRLPAVSQVNISETVRLICISQAEEVAKSTIAAHAFRAQQEVPKIPLRAFPFEGGIDPQLIDEAIARFETQCSAFWYGLLEEIPDKAAVLRQQIRDRVMAEWQMQRERRRAVLLEEMIQRLTETQQKLSREASSQAVNEVNHLSFQTTLDCVSADPFCQTAIAAAIKRLAIFAESLHPRCAFLIPDRFALLNSSIDRDVRTAVDPHWCEKKQAAQAWQAAEHDKKVRDELAAQAERHRQETLRIQAEIERRLEEQAQRMEREKEAAERERKATRPETFSELKESKGWGWDPVGQTVWLYPGGKSGLKYYVLSSSPLESRLTLFNCAGLQIHTFGKRRKIIQSGRTSQVIEQNEVLQNIPFYFDGDTMGIVFKDPVSLRAGQAIHINLPVDTDIENLSHCAYFMYSEQGPRQRVYLTEVGTYTRGPRLQSDHSY